MRINEIHIYQKELLLNQPYSMAGTVLHALDSSIVKLVCDNGLVGWGETCPVGPTYQPEHALGARAALTQMAPAIIGAPALSPLLLRRRMDASLNGHNQAKAAIDIAVMDLIGKFHKLRVCDLLGGAIIESVPSYFAIGIASPQDSAKQAKEKMDQGYPRLQIKCGGRSIDEDIAVIHKIWETVGNKVRLAIDANRSFNSRDTLLLSLACRQIPIVIEQPCNTMEEIASIRAQLHHPVYLDENTENLNDVLRAISLGICDGFGLKLTRLGGLNAFTTVRDICAARSLPHSCDDASGGDIVAAACVHAGATVDPALLEGVWIGAPYYTEHYDPENGIRIENGHINLPALPGLGISPDESKIGNLAASFD
ncbi:MAG: mandelate racemase/muconate lactonizing enzyme family protein [Gammaproteobacteria bacterium]|nr:mandelate racemase/muconate lactonizing enzyme family protein [Gammaproteobacteria bacterium]